MRRRVRAVIRACAALLGAAVLLDSVAAGLRLGGPGGTVAFLSSLTALTNVVAAATFSISARQAWSRRPEPRAITELRGVCVALLGGMAVLFAGIYGSVVLADPTVGSVILHLVIPAIAVVDWVLAPGVRPARPVILWIVVGFLVVWLGCTFVRGALTGEYVYEFLDPAGPGGGQRVVVMTVLMLTCFFLAGALLIAVQRRRTRAAD